jgi:hypothetical protein
MPGIGRPAVISSAMCAKEDGYAGSTASGTCTSIASGTADRGAASGGVDDDKGGISGRLASSAPAFLLDDDDDDGGGGGHGSDD